MSSLFFSSAFHAVIKSIVFTLPFLLGVPDWSDHHKPVLSDENSIAGTKVNSVPNRSLLTTQKLTFETENVFQPDWTFNYEENGQAYSIQSATFPGDINGDGYDDVVIMGVIEWYDPSKAFVYFGSPQGISSTPDQIFGPTWGLFNSLHEVGDVNGDGFADVVWGAFELYLGSAQGLIENPVLLFSDYYDGYWEENYPGMFWENTYSGAPAGDVNGDGIGDMIFRMHENAATYLFYGSTSSFSTRPDWISPNDPGGAENVSFIAESAGDINGDGYGDVIISSAIGHAYLYFGSSNGLEQTPHWLSKIPPNSGRENLRLVVAGDFTGDGFSDLLISEKNYLQEFESYTRSIFILQGSSGGLNNFDSLFLKKETFLYDYEFNQGSISISNLGDINEDGRTDFSIGNEIWFSPFLTYGEFIIPDKSYTDWNYLYNAGDLNGDHVPDIYGYPDIYLNLGIKYYPKPGVNIIDSIRLCRDPDSLEYRILLPAKITGNVTNIKMTRRPGQLPFVYGVNLPLRQVFVTTRAGDHQFDWEVEFIGGKKIQVSNKVKIDAGPLTRVSIKANSAHPKGDPNTFYIGYGAEAFRIEALPAGGGGPYTYLWSNGSTEKNPRISESVPGDYPYWVKMTNVHGCEASDTAIIKVENALCSSPLVDVVMSQYPAILQNPLLANLIKSNSKIAVCKDGQTMCFTKAVVDIRITRAGYTIGACTPGVIPAEAFMTDEMEEILRGGLKVIVAPNPSSHAFQLNVVSIYNEPVMIRIMDLAGRQVEVLNNASSNQTITVGHKLRAGTYIAEVISGKEREVVKLVKTQ